MNAHNASITAPEYNSKHSASFSTLLWEIVSVWFHYKPDRLYSLHVLMNMFWSAVLKIRNVKVVSCCNMHLEKEMESEGWLQRSTVCHWRSSLKDNECFIETTLVSTVSLFQTSLPEWEFTKSYWSQNNTTDWWLHFRVWKSPMSFQSKEIIIWV